MAPEHLTTVRLVLVAIDPPFAPEPESKPVSGPGVRFGLQDRRGVVDAVPATATTRFETELQIVWSADGVIDQRGEHVNGRKGDRFLYLSWGFSDETEPFVMFARAKIKLADLPLSLPADRGEVVDIECLVQATNAKGQPASGTIGQEAVSWRRADR